jgi:hypothetical protein
VTDGELADAFTFGGGSVAGGDSQVCPGSLDRIIACSDVALERVE